MITVWNSTIFLTCPPPPNPSQILYPSIITLNSFTLNGIQQEFEEQVDKINSTKTIYIVLQILNVFSKKISSNTKHWKQMFTFA